MFLNRLTIRRNGSIIRDVPFKKGLNLVLDDSTTTSTQSGNSVGKTTLLRVVDYCLGSDGQDIFTDQEFKRKNEEVLRFLTNNRVLFRLELHSTDLKPLIIERTFEPSDFSINGQRIDSLDDFRSALKYHLFGSDQDKPSLRQLMPKFVRSDVRKMSNTTKFLHAATPAGVYETIFLFLFGFADESLVEVKLSIAKKLKDQGKKLTVFRSQGSEVALKQALAIVERDIERERTSIENITLTEAYTEVIDRIDAIKKQISIAREKQSSLKLRLNFHQLSIEQLNQSEASTDPATVRRIYQEARSFNETLQKSFEEALTFHNAMIGNKRSFIASAIPKIELEVARTRVDLETLTREESSLLAQVTNRGALGDIQVIQANLNRLYETKGEKEQALRSILDIKSKISDLSKELADIGQKMEYFLRDFDNNLNTFNSYFSNFSRELYDEDYILAYSLEKDKFSFTIDNVRANVGGGKKKTQIAAFDLAYVEFARETGRIAPRFVLHDSIEDVHENQISTLFRIAGDIDGQYIIAILRDRVEFLGDEFISANTILSLDEHHKFFDF